MALRSKILTAAVLVMMAVMTLLVTNIIFGTQRQQADNHEIRLRWVGTIVGDLMRGRTYHNNHQDEVLQYVEPLYKSRLVRAYRLVPGDGSEAPTGEGEFDALPSAELVAMALRENRIEIADEHVVVPITLRDVHRWGTLQLELEVPTTLTYSGPALFQNVFLAMCLGTLILLAVLYVLVSLMVVRPIEKLARAADQLAAGKYEFEIPFTHRPDEIGQLIRAFRSMRLQLASYHQQLQTEIDAARQTITKQERALSVAQRLAATGTLAAGIAHEVNNPIGGMLNASLSLKKRHSEDARTVRYLDLIVEGLDRVRETVSKVLQFTPRGVSVGPIPLQRAIDSAVELARHRMKRHNVELSTEVPANLPDVEGNLSELQQVILNMLFNAIDAIDDAGREQGRVVVRALPQAETMRLEIEDNGAGMSEEQAQQAFDLFFTTKDPGKGTGLGLSIAHNIISGHNGTLELESREGEGTTVVITLPLAVTHGRD